MARPNEPIIVDPVRRLRRPETDAEIAECERLELALPRIELKRADFLHAPVGQMPIVRFVLLHGPRPSGIWATWLLIRVTPLIGLSWIARIRAYAPQTRELFTIPRPDALDESIARDAQTRTTEPRIAHVRFGVILPTRFAKRDFPLLH